MPQPRSFRIHGLIIRRTKYREADRILTVLTREKGKITVLAKGVRRQGSKRAGFLEVFSRIEGVVYEGRGLNILGDVAGAAAFVSGIPLETLSFAYYAAEITDKLLPEDEPYPEIYARLNQYLTEIRSVDNSGLQALVEEYALVTLGILGFLPQDSQRVTDIEQLLETVSERSIKTPKFIRKLKHLAIS